MPWIKTKPYIFEYKGTKYIGGVAPLTLYDEKTFQKAIKSHAKIIDGAKNRNPHQSSKFWQVTSNSNPDKFYTVTLYTDDTWTCECNGFKYRQTCSHIDKLKEQVDRNQTSHR